MSKKTTEPEKDKKIRIQRESKNKNKPSQNKKIPHTKSNIKTKKNWSTNFNEEDFDEYYD